jgi:hypothetical protein
MADDLPFESLPLDFLEDLRTRFRNPRLRVQPEVGPFSTSGFQPYQKPYRSELKNLAPRPADAMTPLYEALSPAQGGYSMGELGATAYKAGQEGDWGKVGDLSPLIAAAVAPMGPKGVTVRPSGGQTVKSPYRKPLYPGIYGNPREIAAEAASRVAPESPNLKRVFGVTRDDLAEIGGHGTRKGNVEPGSYLKQAPNPKGSRAAENVMTPKNEQRLLDTLEEAGKHENLRTGMDNWYVMDPAYQALEKELGPTEAKKRWTHVNTMMGMASPGSEVKTEISRGLLAHHLAERGRFDDFVTHGGNRENLAKIGVSGVDGHPYHKTSQAGPMKAYLDSGEMQMASPKVPSYVWASGVPETGFQTAAAVPDAHWSRYVGLGDTRKGPTDIASSASMSEMQQLIPWWGNLAEKAGLQPVPAQARLWGAGSGQTGVTTPIGSPKIEMLADHIAKRAFEEGIPLDTATTKILTGKLYAPAGAAVGLPAIMQAAQRRDDEDYESPFESSPW